MLLKREQFKHWSIVMRPSQLAFAVKFRVGGIQIQDTSLKKS